MDYTLYSLFLALSGNLLLSNIAARVVSASVNFAMNRRLVFQSRGNPVKAAVRYGILAAILLAGNTAVLAVLVHVCGLHEMAAKILTKIGFFFFSWIVQKHLVFRKEGVR